MGMCGSHAHRASHCRLNSGAHGQLSSCQLSTIHLGILTGMCLTCTLVFIRLVLKLEGIFKAEPGDKLTYLKGNKGAFCDQCDRLGTHIGLHSELDACAEAKRTWLDD